MTCSRHVISKIFLVSAFICTAAMLPCPSGDCDCRLTAANETVVTCERADTLTGFPDFSELIHDGDISASKDYFYHDYDDDNSNNSHSGVLYCSSLSIPRADLTTLPVGAFKYLRSRALDLTGNPFDRVGLADDAFEGLERVLEALILADCGLGRVPAALGRLHRLQSLNLDGNKIQMLKRNSFKRNSKLIHLFLKRNGLTTLEVGVFDGLPNLKELHLSGNRLTTIPVSAFWSLSSLTTLDLSNNFIHQLYPGTFAGLGRLHWLELESNSLYLIDKSTFSGLTGLYSLDLDRNPLRSVANGTFAEAKRLRYLSLNLVSDITVIGAGAFRGLGTLVNLAFGDIGRGTLPDGLFTPLKNLRHLSVNARRVTVSGTGSGYALRPDHFRSDMNFHQLQIWVDAIHQCRCATDWIQKLGDRGARIRGSCGNNHQIIQCTGFHREHDHSFELQASRHEQNGEFFIRRLLDYNR